jgi:excinuclease ABC subunit C
LIVDGGKGQLSRATKVLQQFELTGKFFATGLAKQNEELFVPDRSEPILLPRHSQALYLIQRVRDEAHRFAITSHRNRRDKAGVASILDSIPGIGPTRRKALLAHFGGIQSIREASVEDIQSVKGMTLKLAQAVKDSL